MVLQGNDTMEDDPSIKANDVQETERDKTDNDTENSVKAKGAKADPENATKAKRAESALEQPRKGDNTAVNTPTAPI